ncbi:MAG: WYL domain-containing protein [Lachnospiraceae bacterium]|nr:WYL domain-containing protein [Lachnospiraceae bacterium]
MSEFKELIKSFSKSREYVRDFFVYGFKTRDEFGGWSGRTYDNERRRLESWLSGYVRQDYTSKGKNIYLSIDSNLLDTNPLFRVWKAKSFTDNDIMLHFYILDYLLKSPEQTADEIADGLLEEYGKVFDSQIVRRKCNQYAAAGMLIKEKTGKEVLYRPAPPFQELLTVHPGLKNAIKLYQLSSPLGIVGNTIMDTASFQNDLFRIKHNFFVHTLEDEILLLILQAMHEHKSILLKIKSTKSENFLETEGVPLKIFTSTRTGRRYLCLYLPNKKHFTNVRMDAVKSVKIEEPYPDYDAIREKLEKNKESAWGVSFQNDSHHHSEHVKLALHINEHSEKYILNRLQREGKGGVIRQIAPDTFTYETEVFDANEMLPWIRTFIGRIVSIESDCPQLNERFQRDFLTMYHMYFKEDR